jgi:ABC-2 type transport system permease protein
LERLTALVIKEFRQVFRDPAMLRIIFAMPLIQLFVFGYAANTDLRNAKVSVLDQDRSPASTRLTEAFFESEVFVPGPRAQDPAQLEDLLVREEALVTVWIPRGFARALAEGRSAALAVRIDGQNGSVAGRAAGYALRIVERTAARLRAEAGGAPVEGGAAGTGVGIEAVTRFFYNPELESRFYMVPAILVLLITVISTLLTAMAVVREKEIGTLEQIMVTPITPVQLIAGKTIPFVVITFAELAVAATVAVLWFQLPLRGSVPTLALASFVYLLVTMGIGLLASTVSNTQQQAMFTAWFFLVFGILMSGFFYPVENMPPWAEALTAVNPLRWMMTIVRGIFLKGAGLGDVALELGILALMGVVTFGTAVARFQKRVD